MRMKRWTAWCVTGLLAAVSGAARGGDVPAARPAAAGTAKVRKGSHGHRAPADRTQIGPPMRVMHVSLDRLQAYDGYSPARSLMNQVPLVTRLVRVDGKVKSAMVQSNARGTWETVGVGDAARALAIDRVAGILKAEHDVGLEELFLVKIPALGLDFLAHREGQTILLASLFDAPTYGLTAGDLRPAEAVLGSLVAAAQQVPRRPSR
jgi:hypothetical protein